MSNQRDETRNPLEGFQCLEFPIEAEHVFQQSPTNDFLCVCGRPRALHANTGFIPAGYQAMPTVRVVQGNGQ
jgi:hypothetical protein